MTHPRYCDCARRATAADLRAPRRASVDAPIRGAHAAFNSVAAARDYSRRLEVLLQEPRQFAVR